jgi:hypothetical protein
MPRHLTMAHRVGQADDESEPVVIDTDTPNVVILELDNGERLELDAAELRAGLELRTAA